MSAEFDKKMQGFLEKKGRRKLWRIILSIAVAFTVFITTYTLILPALTMEKVTCGIEEHVHSEEGACYKEEKKLLCTEKHKHTDACYGMTLELVCQKEEHKHTSSCYEEKEKKTSTKEETNNKAGENNNKETAPAKPYELEANLDNGIKVKVIAPKEAFTYPEEELELSVKEIEDKKSEDLLEDKLASSNNTSKQEAGNGIKKENKLFDINILHKGKKIQPSKEVEVFFTGIKGAKEDAKVYHIDPEKKLVEDMKAEKEENGDISITAPHFSIYGISYTVDFHNGDVTYSIAGESSVMLSTVFDKLGIKRSIEEVANVDFSNLELISIEKEATDWKLTSLKSFETEETLTITFKDGEVYKLKVTDPKYVNGIPVLTNITDKVGVINENTDTITYYPTLNAAMTYIGPGSAGTNYSVVFTQDYTSTTADWNAVASNGGNANKITFTSTYNDGTGNVRSELTLLNSKGAAHNMNTETEFKNIIFRHGATYPIIYARGHKLTMGEGISNPDKGVAGLLVYGGSRTNSVLNTDVTVLSGFYSYIVAGGSNGGVATANCNLTVRGNSSAVYVVGGSTGGVTPLTAIINMSINGSNGSKVQNIYASWRAAEADNISNIAVGATLNITINNMKNIREVELNSYTSNLGKLKIENDVQIQRRLDTAVDIEMASGANLIMGSNADESIKGTVNYAGRLYAGSNLTLNSNSKIIFAGDGAFRAGATPHSVGKDINVRGSGAEIDIFKSGTKIYPLYIKGTGAYVGTEKLKLGVHKDPNTVNTADAAYGETLLSFNIEANAKAENYSKGINVDGVLKNAKNIVVDKFLDDPIDVGIGHVVVGENNPNYDPKDPISKQYRTVQYVGDTNTVYAHDNGLQTSYTFTGTNLATANWKHSKIRVMPNRNIAVELILAGVGMMGNGRPCIIVDDSDTTITLKDGTVNSMSSTSWTTGSGTAQTTSTGGGGISKSGMKGTLIIRCEHVDEPGHRCLKNGVCGVLKIDMSKTCHVPGIGSAHAIDKDDESNHSGGFSNLYIKGGDIEVTAGWHTPAIGANCGQAHFQATGNISGYSNLITEQQSLNSLAAKGEICKNLNFTGGRIYAKSGVGCAGIGSGVVCPVEDITISNGAYVYAEGGYNSPGIGPGGQDSLTPGIPIFENNYTLKNLVITGGDTVVEAIGGESSVAGAYVPGIGIGQSVLYSRDITNTPGHTININAIPDVGYSAIVKQGTSTDKTQAVYIDGAPSKTSLAIKANQFYTLVYFSDIAKTASVNNGKDKTGSESAPVSVNEGDSVKYKLNFKKTVENNGAITGATITDEIPEGMTLVTTAGSYSPGMTYSNSGGKTIVKWTNQSLTTNSNYFFTVKVDTLPSGSLTKDYINQANLSYSDTGGTIKLDSNKTYHHLGKPAPTLASLKVKKTLQGASTDTFNFEVSFTDATGGLVNIPTSQVAGCSINGNKASFGLKKDEGITITGIPVGTIATITEKNHDGYSVQINNVSAGNTLISKSDTGSLTINENQEVEVINNAGIELPAAGGPGSWIYILIGAGIISTAVAVSLYAKRREKMA